MSDENVDERLAEVFDDARAVAGPKGVMSEKDAFAVFRMAYARGYFDGFRVREYGEAEEPS